MFTTEITLTPIPPFNFDLTAKIFSNGDRQIRVYDGNKFRQVVSVNGKLILITIESNDTVEEPELSAQLKSNSTIDQTDKEQAVKTITRLFNLDLNLAPFYAESKQDKTLKLITQKLRGLRSPTTQSVHEALTDSIVEQQISLKVATSIEKRIIKKFGESIEVDGEVYYNYPKPQLLAQAKIEELRGCGLTQRKAEYIREISTLVTDGKLDLEKFRSYENTQEIIKELDDVRGVGVWTAELTVIRSMQKWDAMPSDDVGLRRIIAHYYCKNQRITSEQAKKIATPWGKWRGLAAFYFVVAEIIGIEP